MEIPSWFPQRERQRDRELPIALDATFTPPRVSITIGALQKIMAYARACPVEVSGLGTVVREGNDLCITDACTLPQVVTSASAETDDWAVHRYLTACVQRGEDPSAVRLQWHSHADGSVYCSGIDLATLAGYPGDFTVSMVVNRRGEYHCRLDLYRPFRVGFVVRLHVRLPEIPADVQDAAAAEVAQHVRSPLVVRRSRGRLARAFDRAFGLEPDDAPTSEPAPLVAVPTPAITVPFEDTIVVADAGTEPVGGSFSFSHEKEKGPTDADGGGATDDTDR